MTTVYSHGTLATLMAGNLGGTISLGELLQHGSMGLGTFDGFDGEVVVLDGEVYQADRTGTVHHVTDPTVTLPFATVHFPSQHQQPVQLPATSKESVEDKLTETFNLTNVFAAVRLAGNFDQVKVRVAPKQQRPYPTLLEATKHQPVFEQTHVSGTLLGYYAPEIFGTVTAAGWHLHFISDDRQFAGHVLEFTGGELTGELEVFDNLEQHFPITDQEFRQGRVDLANVKAGIHAAEG